MMTSAADIPTPLYTVLTEPLSRLGRGKVLRARDHVDELCRLYDPQQVAQFDVVSSAPVHFKVATLHQVMTQVSAAATSIAEVTPAPDRPVMLDTPGHSDGVSHFTVYEGQAVEALVIRRVYHLRSEADLRALLALGAFRSTLMNEPGHLVIEWLVDAGEHDLVARLVGQIPAPPARVLESLVAADAIALLNRVVRKLRVDRRAFTSALAKARSIDAVDWLIRTALRTPPTPDADRTLDGHDYAAVADALFAWKAWQLLPAFGVELLVEPRFMRAFERSYRDVPETALGDFLARIPLEQLTLDTWRLLVLRDARPVLEQLCKRDTESTGHSARLASLARMVGNEGLVEWLSVIPSSASDGGREHAASTSPGPDAPPRRSGFSAAGLLAAIDSADWVGATAHDVPDELRTTLSPAVVKAVEKGYLGLVRWLDAQGVDVRPHDNVTARVADRRGHTALAAFLTRKGPGRSPVR